jgi:hypothetical protein
VEAIERAVTRIGRRPAYSAAGTGVSEASPESLRKIPE